MSNESAGGWVGHVIDTVVEHTQRALGEGKPLASVIVDHAPGFGPMQWATLQTTLHSSNGRGASSERRAVVITSSDEVDLFGSNQFDVLLSGEAGSNGGKAHPSGCWWIVNRVPEKRWAPTGVRARTIRPFYDRCLPVLDEDAWAVRYGRSDLGDHQEARSPNRGLLEDIVLKLYGDPK